MSYQIQSGANMLGSPLLILLFIIQTCSGNPVPSNRWDSLQVKHAWTEVPPGWKIHSPAPLDHRFHLNIGLKQARFDELATALYEVSDPTHHQYIYISPLSRIDTHAKISARYGKHLSKEAVNDFVAPHPDSVQLVESWLDAHDLNLASARRSAAGDWITLTVSVSQAERILGAKYDTYYHADSDDYVVRTMNYSLPAILHEHIAVVAPTTYFGTMKSMKATSFIQSQPSNTSDELHGPDPSTTVPASCSRVITPTCLQDLYGTSNYVPSATNTNSLGIAGYLNEFANDADLQVAG